MPSVRILLTLSILSLSIAVSASAQSVPLSEIEKAIAGPNPKDRVAAIRAVRESGKTEAVVALAPALSDELDDVQLEAIDAVLSLFLGEKIVVRRRVALIIEVRGASRAQAGFELGPTGILPYAVPPQVVTGLLNAIQDQNPRVRTDALYVFGALVRPPIGQPAVEALVEGLLHPDADVRIATAAVLGRLQVKSAGEALIYAMNDPYEDTRIAAIRAVGTVREPRAVQALTEQFSFYGRGDIGRAALWAIARIGSPESIPLLTSLTTDRDAEIRALAFEGLGRAGDATAMAAFESLYASERSRPGQLAIAFALQKNGRPFLGQLLVGLMDERLAARTRDYLLELGPSLVPALQGYLHDANAEVREQVAEVIGVMGNESAVRELDSLRADPNQAVALAAERAIQRIRLTQHP